MGFFVLQHCFESFISLWLFYKQEAMIIHASSIVAGFVSRVGEEIFPITRKDGVPHFYCFCTVSLLLFSKRAGCGVFCHNALPFVAKC